MAFDLEASLRRLKPQKRTARLQQRPDSRLNWVTGEPLSGGAVLLDTTVYLDVFRGTSPPSLEELMIHRISHHSAVSLAELTYGFGRLDPVHPATSVNLLSIGNAIKGIPRRRLHAPAPAMWGEAGMIAGELVRLVGLPEGHERTFLNDALIFLQAQAIGAAVISGNVRDFDFLQQLVPTGYVIFYRPQRPAGRSLS